MAHPTQLHNLRGWGRVSGRIVSGPSAPSPLPEKAFPERFTLLKVAITGGAGSGKSTVARMFRELGARCWTPTRRPGRWWRPGQPRLAGVAPVVRPGIFPGGRRTRPRQSSPASLCRPGRAPPAQRHHPPPGGPGNQEPPARTWRLKAHPWPWWRCRSYSRRASRGPTIR